MPKHKVSLTDRYTQNDGLIHLRGSQAMVRLLLDAGATLDTTDSDGNTALILAAT